MTPLEQRLKEIEERAEAATKGKWVVGISYDRNYNWPVFRLKELVNPSDEKEAGANAEFIAHSRTDISFLLSALRVAMEALDVASQAFEDGPGMYIARQFEDRIRYARTAQADIERLARGEG